jgi:hypothetical protein
MRRMVRLCMSQSSHGGEDDQAKEEKGALGSEIMQISPGLRYH